MAQIKRLIDGLYFVYGKDDSEKDRFSAEDEDYYFDKEFDILFGRQWYDQEKYRYQVFIRRYAEEVSISILGVGHSGDISFLNLAHFYEHSQTLMGSAIFFKSKRKKQIFGPPYLVGLRR